MEANEGNSFHYYTNDYTQRCIFALRGGHLFLPTAVDATIYHGGHFLFIVAGTLALHGKSIYRGGCLKMPATVNRAFTVADVLRCSPRKMYSHLQYKPRPSHHRRRLPHSLSVSSPPPPLSLSALHLPHSPSTSHYSPSMQAAARGAALLHSAAPYSGACGTTATAAPSSSPTDPL